RHAAGARTLDELERARDERVAADGSAGRPTDRERSMRLVRGDVGLRVDLDDARDRPREGRKTPLGSELGVQLCGTRDGRIWPHADGIGAAGTGRPPPTDL